ncbi:cytochrome c oxidase subunit II, partial [Solemya elarraichensis gill symbiont]|uniref:cytochrome c oxidase subunit II n=1 Tax=Solemya elarraichensis gill symbiont TaxID=1918949 RepID=UPI001FE307E8
MPLLTLLSMLFGSPAAMADWTALNLTRGVTPIANQVYDLHMIILWVCIIIGIIVFGAMAWSIIYHRKSKGAQPATFHESTKLEILWTMIPFVILIAIAVPATSTLLFMSDTSTDAEVTIKVTGHQWKWQYEYVDDGINFISNLHPDHNDARQLGSGIEVASVDNYLLDVDEAVVVPINRKIRFLLTASDVIHAWWVPELGQKQDAIPGFINEMWTKIEKEGTYRGQCAELCGKDHGFMPVVVKAVSDEDYASWKQDKQAAAAAAAASSDREWSQDELMVKGESVYKTSCLVCHGDKGQGGVGKPIAGSAIATGDIAKHLEVIIKGVPGTAMAPYASILNDVDIAAVTTYQRNAFGNSADSVQ